MPQPQRINIYLFSHKRTDLLNEELSYKCKICGELFWSIAGDGDDNCDVGVSDDNDSDDGGDDDDCGDNDNGDDGDDEHRRADEAHRGKPSGGIGDPREMFPLPSHLSEQTRAEETFPTDASQPTAL